MIGYLRAFILVSALNSCAYGNERSSVKNDQFTKDFLNCHNQYRAKHHAPPLVYSNNLNVYAQNFANKLAAHDSFYHSGGPYGENLYMSTGYVNGDTVCNAWYSEIKDYSYNHDNPSNFGKVGHFTQLVWKKTTELGVGMATSTSGKTYVVGEYNPPGNYVGDYRANVLPK